MNTSFLRTRQARPALLLLCLAAISTASAQVPDYPSKPVTIITPFAAGSGPDAVLRLVTDKLSKQWGQRVVVDNRPGGAGFIAIDAAKRAAADGYTLLQLDSEHMAALPHLYKSKNFAPFAHFDPIAPFLRTPFFVAVSSESKWRSMADLLATAKAQPGALSYGSWGVGSPAHLGAQQLEQLSGTRMQHVPFREVSQLYASVGANDVPWAFATLPSSQGIYKTGKLRYLAVAAPKRVPQMPEVPTVAEAGGPPSLDVNGFVVLVGPKGLAAPIAARIHAGVAEAISEPDIRARFDTFAFEVLDWSPQEIRRQVELRSELYESLVRRGNISLD
jgi:tripartite-type tricarboxylate transporter receptor subunit TctC